MDDELTKLESENQRLKSAVKELAVLNDISRVINSTMTVEEISRKIMKKVVDAIQAEEAAVHTFSDEDKKLAPTTFVRGKLDSSSITKSRLDIKITGWIARYRKPLLINNVSTDEKFKDANLGTRRVDSLLSVPLSAKGILIGALTVFNSLKAEKFTSDDIRLLSIIGAQSAQIIENARLYNEELRLHKLEGEIQAARKIQEGFLPSETPQLDGFEIFGGSQAALEVGGDFYDFIQPTPDRLFVTLGDVSGKGLPAALLMSTIQGQARLLIGRNPGISPGEIITELNQITCYLSSPTQFATIIIGALLRNTNDIMLANGGHNYPVIARADGKIEEITESSVLIGMFDKSSFDATSCALNRGDVLAIASDGIDEAMDKDDNDYGVERFKQIICDHRNSPAEKIYHAVIKDVVKFRGEAEQSDDITLMIIKRI